MNKRLIAASAVLMLALGVRVWVSAAPSTPVREPLNKFPAQLGEWNLDREDVLTDSISGVLKADDYVMRSYRNRDGFPVDLFIAYYKVQRAGESMHSPKNCLPGWGWTAVQNDYVEFQKDANGKPVWINRYVIEKNGERALVLYWYEAHGRVVASEYWGKIYLVWDALRLGRRDGAIVRLVVPMPKNGSAGQALQSALAMARETYPHLSEYIPN